MKCTEVNVYGKRCTFSADHDLQGAKQRRCRDEMGFYWYGGRANRLNEAAPRLLRALRELLAEADRVGKLTLVELAPRSVARELIAEVEGAHRG